jgi:hypothetical protein
MNDEQYLDYCRKLLIEFATSLVQRTEHFPEDDPLRELAASYQSLPDSVADIYAEGPELVARLFTTYPELAPSFPRQLLFFLGGDCLHYMADEEINQFQQLEDKRIEAGARGETFNLREARAKLLNLQ